MEESLTIPAKDGYPLAAILVTPVDAAPRLTVQIHSGTGYPKEFYLKLARHLAAKGMVVVVFDYRGMGGSRPESLRGFRATMHDWGMLDMTGVLTWLHRTYPGLPHTALGHSAGGQQLGLMENVGQLKRIITVGSSTGYVWHEAPRLIPLVVFLWYVFVPLSNALLGYMGGRAVGLPIDLPKGVGAEWAAWCRCKGYLFDWLEDNAALDHYAEIKAPILAFRATDDPIATERTEQGLFSHFHDTPITYRIIAPRDAKLKKIGHDGLLRTHFQNNVWPVMANWLLEAAR